MTTRDFCFWLQGFAEVHRDAPSPEQWEVIKRHLNLVFAHDIDPSMPDKDGKLQAAHDGKIDLPKRPPSPPDMRIRC